MKTLYVLRHAKSDWGDPALRDFDRPLNERGRKAAKAIGREMLRRGIEPDLVLASPAVRAQETLARVQHAFGAQLRVTNEPRLYGADLIDLVEIVRAAPEEAARLMIVGHNPGFHELVVALTKGGELRREAEHRFPTGALAEIRFVAARWPEVEPGSGELVQLIRPRDL